MSENVVQDYGWSTAEGPHSCGYIAPRVLEILENLKVKRVLDLGAGNGALSSLLASSGFEAVGVEYDAQGVEIAKKTHPSIPFYRFGVQDDPAELLKYEDTFDAVVSTEVVEHHFTGGSQTVDITKAVLKVTANDDQKTYSGIPYSGGNGVAYAGFVGGDTVADLGGELKYGGTSQGAVNAGTYGIEPYGLTSNDYAVSFFNGTLTITGRAKNNTVDSVEASQTSSQNSTNGTQEDTGATPALLIGMPWDPARGAAPWPALRGRIWYP